MDEIKTMNTRERRNRRKHRTILNNAGFDTADPNPMDSLSNFSDVMLVLAVGILLALVLHWNVPLGQSGSEAVSGEPGTVSIEGSDLTPVKDIPDGSEQIGNVYYDARTGRYYILQE